MQTQTTVPVRQAVRPTSTQPLVPRPQIEASRCSWISKDEIAAIVNEGPYKEILVSGTVCTFAPREGTAPHIEIMLLDGRSDFYERTGSTGAEMMDVGDRAVWVPGSRALTVVHGPKMFTVTIVEQATPHEAHYARRTAVAVARALLKKI